MNIRGIFLLNYLLRIGSGKIWCTFRQFEGHKVNFGEFPLTANQYEYLLFHRQRHHNLVFSSLRNRSADLFPAVGIMLTSATVFLLPSHLMMFSYSLSFPLLSFHRLYITLASTLAGLGRGEKPLILSENKSKCDSIVILLLNGRLLLFNVWLR